MTLPPPRDLRQVTRRARGYTSHQARGTRSLTLMLERLGLRPSEGRSLDRAVVAENVAKLLCRPFIQLWTAVPSTSGARVVLATLKPRRIRELFALSRGESRSVRTRGKTSATREGSNLDALFAFACARSLPFACGFCSFASLLQLERRNVGSQKSTAPQRLGSQCRVRLHSFVLPHRLASKRQELTLSSLTSFIAT